MKISKLLIALSIICTTSTSLANTNYIIVNNNDINEINDFKILTDSLDNMKSLRPCLKKEIQKMIKGKYSPDKEIELMMSMTPEQSINYVSKCICSKEGEKVKGNIQSVVKLLERRPSWKNTTINKQDKTEYTTTTSGNSTTTTSKSPTRAINTLAFNSYIEGEKLCK